MLPYLITNALYNLLTMCFHSLVIIVKHVHSSGLFIVYVHSS